jgi:hypothetical protein
MAQVFFHEKQSIPSGWRIVIFGAVTLMMGFVFLMVYLTEWDTMPDQEKPYLFTLLIGPFSVLLMFFIQMDLRITQSSIEFRLEPFRKKYKVISFTDVSEIELSRVQGLKSMKKFGVNKQINRMEYNFGGHHILTVTLKSGKILAFSTFKPQELQYFLRNLPEGTTTVKYSI